MRGFGLEGNGIEAELSEAPKSTEVAFLSNRHIYMKVYRNDPGKEFLLCEQETNSRLW
jgi:hypothetical protein